MANLSADRIEVTRDEQHKKWLMRIWVGDEVIRRYCNEPASAGRAELLDAALKTANDEGYSIDPSNVILP